MKKLICLLAALSLLLCGCRSETEYTSSGAESFQSQTAASSEQQVPSSSSEKSSSKPPESTSAPSSVTPSQVPSSRPSSLVSSGSTVILPTETAGLYYYERLNDEQKRLYALIDNAVKDMASGMIPLGNTTTMDVSLAFTAVRTDHPEYFWMPYSYINKIEDDDFYIAMDYSNDSGSVSYLCTKEQKTAMAAALDAKVAQIKRLIPSGTSDYDAELILHDWICENVTYIDTGDEMHYTAYGAIVNGQAVCEGYARAMQLLCRELSIPCTLVCGTSVERGENHMWNIIKIGGDWYNLDVTWDDDDQNNIVTHRYFNLSDSLLSATHIADPDFSSLSSGDFGGGTVPSYNFSLPRCTSTKYHYPVQSNCTLSTDTDASKTVIREKIKAAADSKTAYCEFYLSYDVASDVDVLTIAKNYSLQNCINDVNSNSNHKIVGTSVALTGRTFIVFLNYGG